MNDIAEFGREYVDKPTEVVSKGSTEVWEILNLTGDTHPIHIHLVNAEVLSRQPFDVDGYEGGAPTLTGKATAPDDNELGWKETVRMNPGEVTRILMKFDVPDFPFAVPPSPRLIADYGISGAEYVWHCHILEHEEHDMMRPLVVTGKERPDTNRRPRRRRLTAAAGQHRWGDAAPVRVAHPIRQPRDPVLFGHRVHGGVRQGPAVGRTYRRMDAPYQLRRRLEPAAERALRVLPGTARLPPSPA